MISPIIVAHLITQCILSSRCVAELQESNAVAKGTFDQDSPLLAVPCTDLIRQCSRISMLSDVDDLSLTRAALSVSVLIG